MNSRKKWMAIFAAVSLTGSMLIAADEPATPTTEPTAEHHRASTRLVKPWSDLTTLTDEQKAKIEKIHADSTEAQRQIRDKERADIEALLTDDQKGQLMTMEADQTAERKERAAKKKTEETEVLPTTEPAQ
jgi:Spy/CpxP family protein refolding chaperone